jgi:hypothetical protein
MPENWSKAIVPKRYISYFICSFINDVSIPDCMASYNKMIGEQRFGKDMEGNNHSLIEVLC